MWDASQAEARDGAQRCEDARSPLDLSKSTCVGFCQQHLGLEGPAAGWGSGRTQAAGQEGSSPAQVPEVLETLSCRLRPSLNLSLGGRSSRVGWSVCPGARCLQSWGEVGSARDPSSMGT